MAPSAAPAQGPRCSAAVLPLLILCVVLPVASVSLWCSLTSGSSFLTVFLWSTAQWIPFVNLSESLQALAWDRWSQEDGHDRVAPILDIPVLHVEDHKKEDVLQYLETTYGPDWRRRPLLLKGLLDPSKQRRLSLDGLLQENLTIPYFTDASVAGALAPDASAPVRQVLANITRGAPHKIGTQLILQAYPELIHEIGTELVTHLFGNYFQPQHIRGTGPFQILPAMTTVPLFIAKGRDTSTPQEECQQHEHQQCHTTPAPRTDMHCEPIGDVSVQLAGSKHWIIVPSEHTFRIQPTVSPDGRAYFWGRSPDFSHVPRYVLETQAGDGIWIPTWTWHRVDYSTTNSVVIAGSLFHFRTLDYFRNNPLLALLMIPNLIKEAVGYNTQ